MVIIMIRIRKQYIEHIRRFYESNLIKVLTGIRRAGKSILLKQIQQELQTTNKISADHIIYINFEESKCTYLTPFLKLKNIY